MSESDRGMDVIADLQERVLRLEGLYSVIDLLGLPALLAGGAAKIFDTTQTADLVADQTPGFFPLERTGDGLPLRWTKYPELAELSVPALEGYPFGLQLTVLRMPHIQTDEDIRLTVSGIGPILLKASAHHTAGAAVFTGEFSPSKSGLLTATFTSRTHLESSGADKRPLGVPFVSLRTFPLMPGSLGNTR